MGVGVLVELVCREIKSKENRIYKEAKKLLQKKHRDATGRFLIEGYNLVLEALSTFFDISCIIVSEEVKDEALERIRASLESIGSKAVLQAMSENQVEGEWQEKSAEHENGRLIVYILSTRLYSEISSEVTSQGVLAIGRKTELNLDGLDDIEGFSNLVGNGNILMLDRIQDPSNIGALLRICEGASYKAVVLIKGSADPFAPKSVRASAGSVFRIPIVHATDSREGIEICSRLNKKIVVTDMEGSSLYYEAPIKENICLVIGNEGQGVSQELREASQVKVRIPMGGRLESLNAAVSAGIIMYEAVRK